MPIIKEKIWQCNLAISDVEIVLKGRNRFWLDVLKSWSKVDHRPYVSNPGEELIWFNSHIRINGVPFMWTNSYKSGLVYI